MGPRRRRWVRRTRRRIGKVLVPVLAPSVLGMLSRSWKVEELGRENFDAIFSHPGRLVTLWHGRMLVPLPAHRDSGVCVLVSPSADGDLMAALLPRFGYGTIRGSSNKNPARALREMLGELSRGGTIVITPDGPRGPRHSTNPGPAWMAKETGFPILPSGCACDRAWSLDTWDRFTIPKLGARIVIVYGEPLFVRSDASDADIQHATDEIGARMLDAEARGFRHLGRQPDW